MYNTMNPSAHPSYSHYYLLSPSTLFFFFFCTSYCFFAHLVVFLHIFLHILLFCTFFISLHILLLFLLFLTICMPLCYVTLYNLYSYYFALSTERTWFDYISLLIIPCINYYVTNKETLNLEPCLKAYQDQEVASRGLHLFTCSRGLRTLVWSAFGAHPSAIAAFSPAQTNRTKRENEL